jgi:hypothetical protein
MVVGFTITYASDKVNRFSGDLNVCQDSEITVLQFDARDAVHLYCLSGLLDK